MPAPRSDGTVKTRGPYKIRAYVSSRLCRVCLRDYLFPAYGNSANKCNDCIIGGKI